MYRLPARTNKKTVPKKEISMFNKLFGTYIGGYGIGLVAGIGITAFGLWLHNGSNPFLTAFAQEMLQEKCSLFIPIEPGTTVELLKIDSEEKFVSFIKLNGNIIGISKCQGTFDKEFPTVFTVGNASDIPDSSDSVEIYTSTR